MDDLCLSSAVSKWDSNRPFSCRKPLGLRFVKLQIICLLSQFPYDINQGGQTNKMQKSRGKYMHELSFGQLDVLILTQSTCCHSVYTLQSKYWPNKASCISRKPITWLLFSSPVEYITNQTQTRIIFKLIITLFWQKKTAHNLIILSHKICNRKRFLISGRQLQEWTQICKSYPQFVLWPKLEKNVL